MNARTFFVGRAIGLLALLAVIGLIAGFFALNNYIYTKKQTGNKNVEPYRATLAGEYVCLPHRDTSGPQSKECALGIKLDSGEYYAVDFSLMSQILPELATGERFSANGLVTPIENLSTDQWQKYPVEGIFSVTDSVTREYQACTQEALECPDGSYVGRTGPRCEFAPCPGGVGDVTLGEVGVGKTVFINGVRITLHEIVEDSRCPADVVCIWAGRVVARVTLESNTDKETRTIESNAAVVLFDSYQISIKSIKPSKVASTPEPKPTDYLITFQVKENE